MRRALLWCIAVLLALTLSTSTWAASSGDGGNFRIQGGKVFVTGANGSLPYISSTDTLSVVAPNTTSTPKFLTQQSSGAPTWDVRPLLGLVFISAGLGGL